MDKQSKKQQALEAKMDRLARVNEFIRVIGGCGRRFLSSNSDRPEPLPDPVYSEFSLDERKRLWYRDKHSRRMISMHQVEWAKWYGFTDGGTLRGLVKGLAGFIKTGKPLWAGCFGPTPEPHWGYDEAMEDVRQAARRLGIVEQDCAAEAAHTKP